MKRLEKTIEDAPRPYRLYHAQKKAFLLWYFYAHKLSAMRKALWLTKWLPVGDTLEVVDVRDGRMHGSYTRHVNYVEFQAETLRTAPDKVRTSGERHGNKQRKESRRPAKGAESRAHA